MGDRYAVRNIRFCEKDCLCLYVCPTGASDTENSVIDTEKCIGCGACAEACPAKAISLVPREYPPQQAKDASVVAALRQLVSAKVAQERLAAGLPGKLAKAAEKSCRIMAEDLLREAGYMLPQSGNARALLTELLEQYAGESGFPAEDARFLLDSISFNEPTTPKEENTVEIWKCTVCGYIHEGPMTDDFTCPRCRQPASKFVKVEPEAPKKNTFLIKTLHSMIHLRGAEQNAYTLLATL